MHEIDTLKAQEISPLKDRCGIIIAYSPIEFNFTLNGVIGLMKLQNRGRDGAGLNVMNKNGGMIIYNELGTVENVFNVEAMDQLINAQGVAWALQVRYGTHGKGILKNIQPIKGRLNENYSYEPFMLVANGQFFEEDRDGDFSDTVIFANKLAELDEPSWDTRIVAIQNSSEGAWSMGVATKDALYLMRDPHGIRPLFYGITTDEPGNEIYVAASETSALRAMGIKNIREVLPGSVIKFDESGVTLLQGSSETCTQAPCAFEMAYIQRATSAVNIPRETPEDINNADTNEAFRVKTGILLAKKEAADFANNIDLVIGIPETGVPGAMAYAQELGKPYHQAIFDQNLGLRTFMNPIPDNIPQELKEHFGYIQALLKGRRVVLVDDSIVRGNITRELVQTLKENYGVLEVHIRVLFPPVDKPCFLGINTRKREELIAARYIDPNRLAREGITAEIWTEAIEGMRQEIGADSLTFVTVEDIHEAAGTKHLCTGCTIGSHPPISPNQIS